MESEPTIRHTVVRQGTPTNPGPILSEYEEEEFDEPPDTVEVNGEVFRVQSISISYDGTSQTVYVW